MTEMNSAVTVLVVSLLLLVAPPSVFIPRPKPVKACESKQSSAGITGLPLPRFCGCYHRAFLQLI